MHVIGTAGHVDHGKSTLVRALTGIDPDRLEEEKTRGMTIDLGFAWADLPVLHEGQPTRETEPVGIVDVPGHIDFIKNMLAGVGGVDATLLVIAADEGIMPQTREHLAILDLLAVPDGVVALTKVDLIDEEEWLDLVELDISEILQDTRLADAPILRVSAETGQGLPELRAAMAMALDRLTPRRNRARPRLPIDRIFTLSGFGTVVTGTLSDGQFTVGDNVEILPQGQEARIRGLQTHKKQIWQGEPGSRLAMNLSGISAHEIRRGDVVTKPNTLRSTQLVDVAFRLLPDAAKPLVHNQAVDFFSGATESPARVRLIGKETLQPGEEGWLQLRLERPVVVVSSDRYILRQPSPSITLGGGIILNPHPRRRWKRFDPMIIARLETLAKGAPDEILLQTLSRQPFLSEKELLAQSGLDLELASAALEELRDAAAVLTLPVGAETIFLTVDTWQRLQLQLSDLLADFHEQAPLRRGMPRGEVRNRLQRVMNLKQFSVRLFNTIIEQATESVAADDTVIWKADFSVTLTLHQQSMVDHVLSMVAEQPYAPPSADEISRLLGDDALLEMMIEQEKLERLSGSILFGKEQFAEIMQKIQDYIQENSSVTLAQTRDLFGTSRKYAQAILEEMDTRRITRRDGDVRVLR